MTDSASETDSVNNYNYIAFDLFLKLDFKESEGPKQLYFTSGTGVKATASISGFKQTTGDKTNYLLLRPVDNCGNKPGNADILVSIEQLNQLVQR